MTVRRARWRAVAGGADAAPCAANGGARRRPPQNSQRVLLGKPRNGTAPRGAAHGRGTSREARRPIIAPPGSCGSVGHCEGARVQSRAPRRGAAARWGHRALPQRDTSVECGEPTRAWGTSVGRGNGERRGCAGNGPRKWKRARVRATGPHHGARGNARVGGAMGTSRPTATGHERGARDDGSGPRRRTTGRGGRGTQWDCAIELRHGVGVAVAFRGCFCYS